MKKTKKWKKFIDRRSKSISYKEQIFVMNVK